VGNSGKMRDIWVKKSKYVAFVFLDKYLYLQGFFLIKRVNPKLRRKN
jgi:hypothetical protein